MIDPTDVTKFDRTDAELEEWWLFSTIVAGKTAATQSRLLNNFLTHAAKNPRFKGGEGPFEIVRALSVGPKAYDTAGNPVVLDYEPRTPLRNYMETAHIGQYTRLERCWRESLSLDLRNDPVEAFEAIHGVGPKTARMFIMHSRPDQRLAAIDTHVLKHLAAQGHPVPKATPPGGKLYRELEEKFLALADAAGESPADYDLRVWKSYARA
jgi:hypothetical protein